MKRRTNLTIIALSLSLFSLAQGIQWTDAASWQQVLDKAKQENKYIFVDCFTTWCTPCKIMDKDIFSKKEAGDFMNSRFIGVKVQMDKTAKDNDHVKNWYADAEMLNQFFRVEAYPTLVVLSPDGKIVDKKAGGMADVPAFIEYAKSNLVPGKVYDDPYAQYDWDVAEYRQGIIRQEKLPGIFKIAFKLRDTTLTKTLLKQHVDYVAALPKDQRYTKEHIKFWSAYSLGSNTRLFRFFYEDSDQIDKVMETEGYAQMIVDRTIMDEIIQPFYLTQTKVAMTGMQVTSLDPAAPLKVDHSEANWKLLKRKIRKKFGKACVERNMLVARTEWYIRHNNYDKYAEYGLRKLEQFPPAKSKNSVGNLATFINSLGWKIFLHVEDQQLLSRALPWVALLVEHFPKESWMLDTYGNLLYKAGRKSEGLAWEEKAAALSSRYDRVVEKMKKGM